MTTVENWCVVEGYSVYWEYRIRRGPEDDFKSDVALVHTKKDANLLVSAPKMVEVLNRIINRCNSMQSSDTKGLLASIKQDAEETLAILSVEASK